jgi:hypothetical protein
MQVRQFTPAEIAILVGTRVALGVGIGLLVSGRLNRDQRKGAGIALVAVGAATTVPFAITAIAKRGRMPSDWKEAA